MIGKVLRIVIEVAECGSFSKAEKHLFISKQAIVKRIDNLEKDLGFQIFSRSSQGITLTPAGEVYIKGIKDILLYADSLLESCRQIATPHQSLRIENQRHPQLLLQSAINKMKQTHPEIELDISLSPDHHSGDRILEGKIDLAEVPGCKDIIQTGIQYTKLIALPYKALVLDSHPFALKSTLTVNDFDGCTIVVNNPKFRHEILDYIKANCTNITIKKGKGEELEQLFTTCYNNDIYLSTSYFLDHIPSIKAIPIQCPLTQKFWVIHRAKPSKQVTLFLEIAEKLFNDQLSSTNSSH